VSLKNLLILGYSCRKMQKAVTIKTQGKINIEVGRSFLRLTDTRWGRTEDKLSDIQDFRPSRLRDV